MSEFVVYLSASAAAVDAALFSKADGAIAIAADRGISLSRTGAIGDGVNDLPLLLLEPLALRATLANAQPEVKAALLRANGVLFDQAGPRGFLDFYKLASARGLSLVVADRDGVLLTEDMTVPGRNLVTSILAEMGIGSRPQVAVITGSSFTQNVSFIKEFALADACRENRWIKKHPFFIFAENGVIPINVLREKEGPMLLSVDRALQEILKGPFEQAVVERVRHHVAPAFRLDWSDAEVSKPGVVFSPAKRTMVTIEIPQCTAAIARFRETSEANHFGLAVLSCMIEVADQLGIPFRVLN